MPKRQGTHKVNSTDQAIDSLRAELIQDYRDTDDGFAEPLHTQTPNDFFDYHLPRIDSLAELKVICVFIRESFGWHRLRFKMDIGEILTKSGLKSRKSVTEGVKAAQKRGLIKRANPGSHKKAEWELIVSRKLYATNAYNLRDKEVNSTRRVGVKESKKKLIKEGKTTTGASAVPELVLYKSIVRHWPRESQRESVVSAIQKVGARLGHAATSDDLLPFWKAWGVVSGNEWSLVWLVEWAVSGQVRGQNGKNGTHKQETKELEGEALERALEQANSLLEESK